MQKLRNHLSMDKKGQLGGAGGKMMDRIIAAVVAILVVFSLLSAITAILFAKLINFTETLAANDTTGIASAFQIVLPILLVVGLVAAPIAAIALISAKGKK